MSNDLFKNDVRSSETIRNESMNFSNFGSRYKTNKNDDNDGFLILLFPSHLLMNLGILRLFERT